MTKETYAPYLENIIPVEIQQKEDMIQLYKSLTGLVKTVSPNIPRKVFNKILEDEKVIKYWENNCGRKREKEG